MSGLFKAETGVGCNNRANMDYEGTGQFLPNSVSFSNHLYHERNAPLVLAHTRRANSRTWPMGDLGGSLYSRVNMRGEDSTEAGPARRRIAVAVSFPSLPPDKWPVSHN